MPPIVFSAASHDTRARAARRRRLGIILAAVILPVIAFALAWYLKSGKPEGLQAPWTSPGGSNAPQVATIEPVASPVKAVNTLEYFLLDTVHSLTLTTTGSGSLQATRLQHYLGKQAVEDREVYVVGEAYISDGKIVDFEYTLYLIDEKQDIYWAGEREAKDKVKWERQPRLVLPGRSPDPSNQSAIFKSRADQPRLRDSVRHTGHLSQAGISKVE